MGSNLISKLLRPYLEKRRLLPLTLMVVNSTLVTAGVMIPPTHAFDYAKTQEQTPLGEISQEVVTTARTYMFPVVEPIGVSQGYHGFHRGIDIRAPKGSPVVTIANGVVIEVKNLSYGYGKHVRIAHDGTVASLYAHLDSIEVRVGDRVEKGKQIGTIGLTGWSTGPHLHFELVDGQGMINPYEILSSKP